MCVCITTDSFISVKNLPFLKPVVNIPHYILYNCTLEMRLPDRSIDVLREFCDVILLVLKSEQEILIFIRASLPSHTVTLPNDYIHCTLHRVQKRHLVRNITSQM